ncbi:MAG: cell wall metabolism sensor histidine kinase WalK [Ruminococcaceae bacterium]|nr:cell wall metabolism sensor histidine kinase WalK [Oscillospiraceae bacterium]
MNKSRHHKKSRFGIAQRIAILFTLAMLVLVIVIGVAFTVIFRNRAKNDLKESSRETAVIISNLMSKTLTLSQSPSTVPPYQRPAGGDDFGRLPGQQSDFWINEKTLIAFINNLTSSEVWIIDTKLNMLSSTATSASADISQETIKDIELSWINKIMSESGYFIYTEDFSDSLGDSYLSVGVPVYASTGNKIVGAVLVHASMDSIDAATFRGLLILGASSIVALMVGLIASWIIAKIITKPLYQIRNTAVMISEGDYTIQTGINRSDEIGELALTLDEMGKKLEAADEESRKLERLRRDFISNISHELRTPVTVMRSSLEALCEGVVTDEAQVEEYHRQMLSESVYLQRMVNDLLDLSRLQNADFKMNVGVFNLYDCLSDAVRSARRIALQKDKTVEFEYDTTLFTVTGDYDRIRQLFMIVLDNAVKFTALVDDSLAPGGEVTPEPVRVRFERGIVSITNTGSEIKQEEIPFIFDRFFKSHSEENKEGTGLGLAIAKQIALRHGIGVRVLSKNKVTTFVFEFQMVSDVGK